jgi:hypothetical protein
MTATASNMTATRIDGAAFFIVHLVLSVIYHADRGKEKCDSQRKGDGDWLNKKPKITVRLN